MSINLTERIKEIETRLPYPEKRLGKELTEPFSASISGSRKILYSTQSEQAMQLINAEVPYIQTGYENEFGRRSSSFIQYDSDAEVLDKIEKFTTMPGHHYFLIVHRKKDNKLDIIERVSYEHITETYGYYYDTKYLDRLNIGEKIKDKDVVLKSVSFDEFNNRMDTINALTMYVATNFTTEDAIIVSESCAKKFTSPLCRKVQLIINENDILLNLYGDRDIYKVIPDIGEEVQNSLLAAVRRENKQESLFSQIHEYMRDISISDEKITASGRVIDIDIMTNNPELMEFSIYNTQLNMYYQDSIRFHNELVEKVSNIKRAYGCGVTYRLDKMYQTSRAILAGGKYNIDGNTFSNIVMDIYVMEDSPLHVGDKLSNRYGGKGCISKIVPDDLMPHTPDGDALDLIYNQATVVNRLNPSQLFEMEINSASRHLIKNLELITDFDNEDDVDYALNRIIEFVKFFSEREGDELYEDIYGESMPIFDERLFILQSYFNDGVIFLSLEPVRENMTIDRLREMYKLFPETKQDHIYKPMFGSDGEIRYVKSQRPVLVAPLAMMRLKQYAEEKFSVTSLSYTNARNENSRSKNSSMYRGLFTNTPIKFGEMESGEFCHLGDDINIIALMLYSTSPHGRRMAKTLLTDNPFDIDVVLDENARSRSAEILNTYLKAIGLRLVFSRLKKKYNRALMVSPKYTKLPKLALLSKNQLKWLEENNKGFDFNQIELVESEVHKGVLVPQYKKPDKPLLKLALVKNVLVHSPVKVKKEEEK